MMWYNKDNLQFEGQKLSEEFCKINSIPMPEVKLLKPTDRLYHLATCAYYRPTTITIMVSKCAAPGMGGRAWSWPGYVIDRTPFGVMQHELGHHVDNFFYNKVEANWHDGTGKAVGLFSKLIYDQSKEPALTGYLGTDKQEATFYMEWFAENFRLFVTNPHLSYKLRSRFYKALREYLEPVIVSRWETRLRHLQAPSRIIEQARKKINKV